MALTDDEFERKQRGDEQRAAGWSDDEIDLDAQRRDEQRWRTEDARWR